MIELAFVAPFFFLMIFAILEFGKYLWIQQVVVNSTRESCRYLTLASTFRDRSLTLTSSTMIQVSLCFADNFKKGATTQAYTTVFPLGYNPTITIPSNRTSISQLRTKDQVSVTAEVPFTKLSWAKHTWLNFFETANVNATVTLEIE